MKEIIHRPPINSTGNSNIVAAAESPHPTGPADDLVSITQGIPLRLWRFLPQRRLNVVKQTVSIGER